MHKHPLCAVAAAGALILTAAPTAGAAPPKSPIKNPADPSPALSTLLAKSRSETQRKALGLPGYKALLGKKWSARQTKADAMFAKQVAAAKTGGSGATAKASGDVNDPDPLGAADAIKGRNAKQTRKLRIATGLDAGCPTYRDYGGGSGAFAITGYARGDYVVTTVERVGRYDITTSVVFDVRFRLSSQTTRDAGISDGIAEGGTISVTRSQTAYDRKTKKTRKTGPTQRLSEALSPLLILDGDFDDFIASQDDDEAPAPRRPLRTSTWDDVSQAFVAVVFGAIRQDYRAAERRIQTPGACLDLTFAAPERLAPGQTIGLTGHPVLVHGTAPEAELYADGHVTKAEYVNEQGQMLKLHGGIYDAFTPNVPWYDFTAPPAAWPEERPAGVRLTYVSPAGVAEGAISFKPLASKLFFKVIGVSGTVDATDVTNTGTDCTFNAGPQHVDIGTGTQTDPTQGMLDTDFGQITTSITHTTQPYSTLYDCPGTDSDVPCDFPLDSLPNQHLGVNLRQTGDGNVRLGWGFVAVQLGDSRCSLQVPDVFVDQSLLQTTVPLSTFQETGPFTIEASNQQPYSVQQGITTQSGKLRWTFKITLQRVNEDGSAL
jgi:hypothetical protein